MLEKVHHKYIQRFSESAMPNHLIHALKWSSGVEEIICKVKYKKTEPSFILNSACRFLKSPLGPTGRMSSDISPSSRAKNASVVSTSWSETSQIWEYLSPAFPTRKSFLYIFARLWLGREKRSHYISMKKIKKMTKTAGRLMSFQPVK